MFFTKSKKSGAKKNNKKLTVTKVKGKYPANPLKLKKGKGK